MWYHWHCYSGDQGGPWPPLMVHIFNMLWPLHFYTASNAPCVTVVGCNSGVVYMGETKDLTQSLEVLLTQTSVSKGGRGSF